MELIKDAKRLVDHIVAIALIRSTVNNKVLTHAEKILKINSHLNDLDRNLKEVNDEKTKI